MAPSLFRTALSLVLAAFVLTATTSAQSSGLLLFAASSMQTALDVMKGDLEKAVGLPVRISYAASSALARQLENGAPADVFVSADLEWMDYVETKGLLRPNSRTNIAGNTLVLIAPAARPVTLDIVPGFPLARRLGNERLAVADPVSVPAGKYARAALTSLGVWDAVADRLAPAENVRGALVLVSRGEAPLGIVYRTDALVDPGVMIAGTFPATTHPPIVYPAAVTRGAVAGADQVITYLRGPAAAATFERLGFLKMTR